MEAYSILRSDGSGKDGGGGGAPKVLYLIASALEKAIQRNEQMLQVAKVGEFVTIFHSSKVPPLSIRQYVERIFKYSRCSPSCFVMAYVYMDWFCQRTKVRLTSLNVHRLLITSVLVAAKFIDNGYLNNAYQAKVGGVGTLEMNKMEMKFLFDLGFRLFVSPEVFNRYCFQLEKEDSKEAAFRAEQNIYFHRLGSWRMQR